MPISHVGVLVMLACKRQPSPVLTYPNVRCVPVSKTTIFASA